MRTLVENSSPSVRVHSAPVAPRSCASFTADCASSVSSIGSGGRPADRHFVNANGGDAYADRDALSFLSADANAFIERKIAAHHAHVLQRLRPVADERCALHRA